MIRKDPMKDRKDMERREEDQQERDRATAPPIEREHETYAGVLEEDERREQDKQS